MSRKQETTGEMLAGVGSGLNRKLVMELDFDPDTITLIADEYGKPVNTLTDALLIRWVVTLINNA